MAGVCEFIDDNDVFFTPYITEIPLTEIGISIGLGAIGKLLVILFRRNVFIQWIFTFTKWKLLNIDLFCIFLDYLLVLGPSRSSAQLGFGSSFWAKKLGSARHILEKSSVQLGLLYDFKKQVTLKNKKWADFQHFCQIFKV